MNELKAVHRKRDSCRACGGTSGLQCFLSFGPTPLANFFPQSPDEFAGEMFYPLDVYFCEKCSLVQLLDVIDPKVLFRNYIYVSGTSETMANHYRDYAEGVVGLVSLTKRDLILEVASNDGSLLRCFQRYGLRTLGIEPATNVAALANANGVETINQFLSIETARQIQSQFGQAKLVIANNVLAHVDDTVQFLQACKILLDPDGILTIEVPYLRELMAHLEYDTVYHEHLCYFSITTLLRISEAADLAIHRIERLPVHGGSLRAYLRHRHTTNSNTQQLQALCDEEAAIGLSSLESYFHFAERVKKNKNCIRSWFEKCKAKGARIGGYGAPAKGNTLLNYCGVGSELLPYTVDKNPWKVGRFTPGMHIPVLPVSALAERQPDYVFLLAWNLAEEIMNSQQSFAGKFVIPIPEVRMI